MCVILAAIKQNRPSEDMVRQAWKRNDDGGGIAYREKDAEGISELVWKKNLDLDEMVHLCGTVNLPYIAHFRIASSGGVRPELCHPFPINVGAPRVLEGRSKDEYVLFHNGDWREWQDYVLKAAINPIAPDLPAGKWNDTRGMSWLCSIYGIHFMDLIEHKGVAFSANDYEIFVGKDGWKEINGVWCSNDFFWSGPRNLTPGPAHHQHAMCKERRCQSQFGLIEGYCEWHKDRRSLPAGQTIGPVVGTSPLAETNPLATPDRRVTDGDKSSSNDPSQGLETSKSDGDRKKKEIICQECKSLLNLNIPHADYCSRSQNPGMVCSGCNIPPGRPHLTHCPVLVKGYTCFECKQVIKTPVNHFMTCSHFNKPIVLPIVSGNAVKPPESRGLSEPSDPFHVVLTAAKAWKNGKMSGNELKIVKKRLGFQNVQTKNIEELEKWAIAERKKLKSKELKDPRLEQVTTVVH